MLRALVAGPNQIVSVLKMFAGQPTLTGEELIIGNSQVRLVITLRIGFHAPSSMSDFLET